MTTIFKPELTAIDTRQSKSAKIIVDKFMGIGSHILDYGCGTGRNMRYIHENNIWKYTKIDGCDIAEQIMLNEIKHDQLREKGMDIFEDTKVQKEKYDLVLNSHVLNVIEKDEIKAMVVKNIYDALKEDGYAIIEVRTKKDVEGAKTKIQHGDGWKIKCKGNYTYQEGITKEKMNALITSVGFKIEEHICNSGTHIVIAKKENIRKAVA